MGLYVIVVDEAMISYPGFDLHAAVQYKSD